MTQVIKHSPNRTILEGWPDMGSFPWIFDPQARELHIIEDPRCHHPDVAEHIERANGPYPTNMVMGRIEVGTGPRSLVTGATPGHIWTSHQGDDRVLPDVAAALDPHFDFPVRPFEDEEDWTFAKVATGLPEAETNVGGTSSFHSDDFPVIFNPHYAPNGKVYVGRHGAYHWDMIRGNPELEPWFEEEEYEDELAEPNWDAMLQQDTLRPVKNLPTMFAPGDIVDEFFFGRLRNGRIVWTVDPSANDLIHQALGLEPDDEEDDWRFSKTATAAQTPPGFVPWEPGDTGKAMVFDGVPYTWATRGAEDDKLYWGAPHHTAALNALGPGIEEYKNGDGYFYISTKGEVTPAWVRRAGAFEELLNSDPRLRGGESSWHFGSEPEFNEEGFKRMGEVKRGLVLHSGERIEWDCDHYVGRPYHAEYMLEHDIHPEQVRDYIWSIDGGETWGATNEFDDWTTNETPEGGWRFGADAWVVTEVAPGEGSHAGVAQGQRPFVAYPHSKSIYVGGQGDYHADVFHRISETDENIRAGHAIIGAFPVEEGGEWFWLKNEPKEEIAAALEHLAYKGDEPIPSETWVFGKTSNEELQIIEIPPNQVRAPQPGERDGPMMDWWYHRRPFVYYPDDNEVMIGPIATYHSQIAPNLQRDDGAGIIFLPGVEEATQGRCTPEVRGFSGVPPEVLQAISEYTGLPVEVKEEWRFGSLDLHQWRPGSPGKGFLLNDGTPVTWNLRTRSDPIGGSPHHSEYAEMMGLPEWPEGYDEEDIYGAEMGGWHTPVYISAEGVVTTAGYWPGADYHPLDPFLALGLQPPAEEDDWGFG